MSDLFSSSDLRIAIIAAAFGTFATFGVQYAAYRYRLFMSFKRFRRDLDNLDRHVAASIKSLSVPADSPRYLIAARMRFCKFMDGMRSIEQLEWLTQRRDSDRILPTLLAIRNSDIFMEELASRVDAMSEEELGKALEDACINMRFLHSAVVKLGYGTEARAGKMYSIPTQEIIGELNASTGREQPPKQKQGKQGAQAGRSD